MTSTTDRTRYVARTAGHTPCVSCTIACLGTVVLMLALPATAAARQQKSIRLDAGLSLATTYDSNLEHKPAGLATFGIVAGANARLRLPTGAARTNVEYRLGAHRYEEIPQRNRTSHDLRLTLDIGRARPVTLGTIAAASIGGVSEDREVGTQYSLTERLDVQLGQRNRIRVSGAYQHRQYGERSGRNTGNWAAGIGYRIGGTGQPRLEVQTRHDRNTTTDARSAFRRWTYRAGFDAPLGQSSFGLAIRRVTREYPQRLVQLEELRELDLGPADLQLLEDYELVVGDPRGSLTPGELLPLLSERWRNLPRRDEIWAPSAQLVLSAGRAFEIELSYEFEGRLSTDLRRGYSGHTTRIGSRMRL